MCSGAQVAATSLAAKGKHVVELDCIGDKKNVNIRFENVAKILRRDLSPRLVDFLEEEIDTFSDAQVGAAVSYMASAAK